MCTNALYDLAAHPEYIAPLRAEAEAVVAEHGWTKAAMGELHKLDSFIRESHRIWAALSMSAFPHSFVCGLSRPPMTVSMTRVAKVPHTFSNGVTIPKGTTITISSVVHADDEVYPDADKFQPFRHIEGANRDVEPARRQFVSPSAEYRTCLVFVCTTDVIYPVFQSRLDWESMVSVQLVH